MGAISVILLVAFIIVCVLLVLIVLAQGEETNGMGGVFGAGNSVAFGARSDSILTKITYVLVTLFFLGALGLAFVYKSVTPGDDIAPISVSPSSGADEAAPAENWVDAVKKAGAGQPDAAAPIEATVDGNSLVQVPLEELPKEVLDVVNGGATAPAENAAPAEPVQAEPAKAEAPKSEPAPARPAAPKAEPKQEEGFNFFFGD